MILLLMSNVCLKMIIELFRGGQFENTSIYLQYITCVLFHFMEIVLFGCMLRHYGIYI